MAEGTIKFTVKNHRIGPPLVLEDYQDIEVIRSGLWQRRLIGHDESANVGYGNISCRRSRGGFVISGTQTGYKEVLDGGDYVVIDAWDFVRNSVSCTGPCLPSSEALSHAALYQRPDVGGVIHVHCRELWDELIQAEVLSTEEDIAYGSEALYQRLGELAGSVTGLPLVIVTKGHQDGVFAAGADLAQAYEAIVGLLA